MNKKYDFIDEIEFVLDTLKEKPITDSNMEAVLKEFNIKTGKEYTSQYFKSILLRLVKEGYVYIFEGSTVFGDPGQTQFGKKDVFNMAFDGYLLLEGEGYRQMYQNRTHLATKERTNGTRLVVWTAALVFVTLAILIVETIKLILHC